MTFSPNYKITQNILNYLTTIENVKESFKGSNISPVLMASLKSSAKIASIHYSTKIEGNRLTQKEVEETIFKRKVIENRQRDSSEVNAYYKAMNYIEKCVDKNAIFSEKLIQQTHDLVEGIKSSYRDGQNAIYDNASGDIVYLPPEAKEVKILMKELVEWVNTDLQTPRVIVAALVHYQFVTIHPYYDGNGRTARLLTSFLMRKFGYGLKGIYSLEEYYANDLNGYYEALTTHVHHNYYEGRETADLTKWIEYFVRGVADVFGKIQIRAVSPDNQRDFSSEMRKLDVTQRKIMELFTEFEEVTSMQIAKYLGMSQQSGRQLANRWIDAGFLCASNSSKKARKYRLSGEYERIIVNRTR
ncbi:MAG: Fic family protein [Alphaproteobacteria bacterium]|nr:Fic family protein [Alphaproteobacteria bacterium]